MNSDLKKGTICSIISALIFGLTPILSAITFEMGSNALTLTFYRNLMAVPVLAVILLIRKIDLRITLRHFLSIAAISIIFSFTTTYILYDSYNYIGVGLATTLHFLYPVFTVLFGWLFFKKKMNRAKIFALFLATAGVALATGEGGAFAFKGILMAVISAVTYAGYLLGIEESTMKEMDSMKSMFYMCIINSAVTALVNVPMGEIVYALSPLTLFYTLIISVANSAFAYILLIIGIKMIGAGNAAIFSMLEPVSGVVAGVVFLKEKLPFLKLVSCVLILIAVMIPIMKDRSEETDQKHSDKTESRFY